MSLKAFHLLFITAATLLSLFFATWSVRQFAADRNFLYVVTAIAALGAGGGLVYYGSRFARKLKHVSFL